MKSIAQDRKQSAAVDDAERRTRQTQAENDGALCCLEMIQKKHVEEVKQERPLSGKLHYMLLTNTIVQLMIIKHP